jgi:hypothetical protein
LLRTDVHPQQAIAEIQDTLRFVSEELRSDLVEAAPALGDDAGVAEHGHVLGGGVGGLASASSPTMHGSPLATSRRDFGIAAISRRDGARKIENAPNGRCSPPNTMNDHFFKHLPFTLQYRS